MRIVKEKLETEVASLQRSITSAYQDKAQAQAEVHRYAAALAFAWLA